MKKENLPFGFGRELMDAKLQKLDEEQEQRREPFFFHDECAFGLVDRARS